MLVRGDKDIYFYVGVENKIYGNLFVFFLMWYLFLILVIKFGIIFYILKFNLVGMCFMIIEYKK